MATIKRTETSNVTWKEVLEIINSGKATEKLKPGTEITETLKDGSSAVIAVAAVDLYQNGEVFFFFLPQHCRGRSPDEQGVDEQRRLERLQNERIPE